MGAMTRKGAKLSSLAGTIDFQEQGEYREGTS